MDLDSEEEDSMVATTQAVPKFSFSHTMSAIVGPSAGPTSRSLTEVFILMRNNAMQSKHIFADRSSGNLGNLNNGSSLFAGQDHERMSLVPLHDQEDDDPDIAGGVGGASAHLSRIPPEWVSIVDEAQYEMGRVRTKLKELRDLQNKHVLRPNFEDDTAEEERSIKVGSEQVTQMLAHCQRLIQHIQKSGLAATASPTKSTKQKSHKLMDNVVRALFAALQGLMAEFRSIQTGYLKKLRTREDNYQQYFDMAFTADQPAPPRSPFFSGSTPAPTAFSGSLGGTSSQGTAAISAMERGDEQELQDGEPMTPPHMSMAQLTAIEQSSAVVEAREREIIGITRSILELNTMFKDLATIVLDQGSVVDRIDYNIEQSSVRVRAGLAQVKKAEKYQKKNRKLIAIIVLSAIVALLLIILVIQKAG